MEHESPLTYAEFAELATVMRGEYVPSGELPLSIPKRIVKFMRIYETVGYTPRGENG